MKGTAMAHAPGRKFNVWLPAHEADLLTAVAQQLERKQGDVLKLALRKLARELEVQEGQQHANRN